MTKIKSVEEALQLFEEYTIKRGYALDADDFKTYNKLFSQVQKCKMYLYEMQQIHLLHLLFMHKNQHVRFSAASALLPLYEEECTKILSDIASGNHGLLSLNAQTTLMMWRDGELKFPCQINSDKETVPQMENKSSIEVNNKVEHVKSEEFSPEILRLSRLFECPPTSDTEIRNEECEFYIRFSPATEKITININTFVNPYTQEVETVCQERLKRFKSFAQVATIEANEPSKLGFMQIVLTIVNDKATDDVLTQIKEVIYTTFSEWKPNESRVWFKTEYHEAICYFEGQWWMPTRAVIKNGEKYERYDFSDEMKYDEQMWEIAQGEYDELETSDSFALIGHDAFQRIWDNTECIHVPEPW
jgi:hypothetical protein